MKHFLAQVKPKDFNIPQGNFDEASVSTIFQIVFAIIGAIAIIILMLASLKYITSRGDPNSVAKAKNTIIYAVIGLIISASAFTIVAFVVDRV